MGGDKMENDGAFVEDSRFYTTGYHHHCPHRRFVGAVSKYVCDCDTPESGNVEPIADFWSRRAQGRAWTGQEA